jgi:hypothetical protein
MISRINILMTVAAVLLITAGTGCIKEEQKVVYEYGTFPEEVVNLESVNTEYDDYNMDLPRINSSLPYIFSSNRTSSGENFNLVSANIYFLFNQISGEFEIDGEMYTGNFFGMLLNHFNDEYDQLGPYRFFNSRNGLEYFFVTSGNEDGNLDILFTEYTPPSGDGYSVIPEPVPATRLNSVADDAYISIDWDIKNIYLTSDRDGDFDIYTIEIDYSTGFNNWLTGEQSVLLEADSVNSDYNDKCPYIFDKYMIFASDKPGGLGGFDLYYSEFKDGKWNSPVNLGPEINSEYNEYRPVIGLAGNYTNNFMIFSSDRPGGEGGYDLYFTGITLQQDKK